MICLDTHVNYILEGALLGLIIFGELLLFLFIYRHITDFITNMIKSIKNVFIKIAKNRKKDTSNSSTDE